ncbi:thiamine pyrophosphate-binding protein [Rhizobium bangladeshense]|uniref:thiamine pyrophosphate-binding protein n=1 Tax=Rhizobium bangladeshense TaxID=1138189 RepID=UPI0007E58ECA|nr:thiamine pyrophosphate-binding protein [Rhizobium bangladeshense]
MKRQTKTPGLKCGLRMKVSDLSVAELVEWGVVRVYGVPGEEILDFMDSLRNSNITFVPTRTEWGAALMAATEGRLTGRPGVCIATCGPGGLNFPNGAAYAYLGGFPMVMIAGQKPINSSLHGHFQNTDLVSVMTPLTKLAVQIESLQMIRPVLRDAFRIAQEEKPGPVFVVIPEDIAAEEGEEN